MEGAYHTGDSGIAAGSDSFDVEEDRSEGNTQGKKDVMWRVRVCPIFFADFCRLKIDFMSIHTLTESFEYRMSQYLCTKVDPKLWSLCQEPVDTDMPWLPNEKTYTKPSNAATAGLLEMTVPDSDLLDLVTLIRTINLSKKSRMRFELKRLLPGDGQKEGGQGRQTAAVEGDGKPVLLRSTDMLVNFSFRLQPVKVPAFKHPEGYVLKPEDKQIYLSKIPADVPDHVLKAILCTPMLVRKAEEDGTSTAVFHVISAFGAQGYMELFEGVMVNFHELEMATTLGTLIDAKKIHSDQEIINRTANEQEIQAIKRKPDGSLVGPLIAKKPREDFAMGPPTWVRGQPPGLHRGALMRGAPRGQGSDGAPRSARREPSGQRRTPREGSTTRRERSAWRRRRGRSPSERVDPGMGTKGRIF